MKIISRLEPWAARVGQFWGAYWLLISGSFFVLVSVILKWLEFPFSRNLKGLQLPLLHQPSLLPHISIFSFGFFAVVVLVAGILLSRVSVAFLGAAAAVLLTIFALVPADLAFVKPGMLQRLTEESEVIPLVKSFTKSYLPVNYGASEDIPKRLNLYSGFGRFLAAASYLRLGWYCFGIGTLLVAGYALSQLRGQRLMLLLALVGLPLAADAVVLAPAMIGQHYLTRGSLAKAEGRNQDAIQDFRRAMQWDAWHALDIDLYGTIGELQRLSGTAEGSPERHVSRALSLEKVNEYEQAIFELETAAEAGGALGKAAQREAARVHIDYGLALYQAGGIGSAVTNWQAALAKDPTQVYALPYLGRGYFDLGDYQSATQVVDQEVKIVKDHTSLLGDAYSLAGDSYAKLGQDNEARKYYNLSLAVDPIENYWALTGLAGE